MKMRFWAAAALAAALILGSNPAHAYLHTWSTVPTVTGSRDIITDLLGAAPLPGQKIVAAWHAFDGIEHFFRIDLAAAPSPGSFAGIYGIYIDSAPGGIPAADPAARIYIPRTLEGIEANYDYILDSHYQPFMYADGWGQNDLHAWTGSTLSMEPVTALQTGATLEWRVAAAALGLPPSFLWTAASLDSGSLVTTYTMTDPVAASPVPIPGTAVLLASGLPMLGAFRRRAK